MQGMPNSGVFRLAYMNTWNERVRERREELGMSQAELARRVGVKPPSVFEWEDGTIKNLRGPNLMRVSAELGVTPTWLLTGRGPRAIADLSPEALEFAALYEQCPADQRADLMKSTKALVRGLVADSKEIDSKNNEKPIKGAARGKRSLPVEG